MVQYVRQSTLLIDNSKEMVRLALEMSVDCGNTPATPGQVDI